jgi:SSS family solute:Na+ symporter
MQELDWKPRRILAFYHYSIFVWLAIGGLIPWASAVGNDQPLLQNDRRDLVDVMQQTLDRSTGWVRIHAAEALLWHGYHEVVAAAFPASTDTSEPGYRIGVWRVWAQVADSPDVRKDAVDRIRLALRDPEGLDRVHAAESLAKLGDLLEPADLAAAEQMVTASEPAAQTFGLWLLADAGRADARQRLLDQLQADDPIARLRAAFAVRGLKQPLTAAERATVFRIAAAEPDDTPAKVYLMGTAWLFASKASGSHSDRADREAFGESLRRFAASGSVGERYAAVMAIADGGTPDEMATLRLALADEDADVRSAAAHALLRMDRRRPHRMAVADWGVIATYLSAMVLIGWYFSRQVFTTDDYLLGGRRMKPWAVGLSLFATLLSTISYLSWPGEIIMHGPMFLCGLLSYPFIAWAVGWWLIPYFMQLNVTSAYEILELRLGLSVRLLGSLFFLSLRLLWMAVIIYATISKVLVPLMGLDASAIPWLCALLGAITVIYTSLGGLRAVVFTDVIQTGILFGGAILAMIVITAQMGGVAAWWPTQWSPNWQTPTFGYDPNARVSLVGVFIATFTWFVCTAGSDQMAIQRYLATRDVRAARRMFNISLLTGGMVQVFLALLGLALLAYFRDHRYLLADGQTIATHADQLFPQFIVIGLPAGISGLVVAGLLAAAMSSLSSGLNSSCSVIAVDFFDRFRKPATDEQNHVLRARIISATIGIVVVMMSTMVGVVQGNMLEIAFKVVNLLVAPLFGLFFMAMFVRWATALGTIIGSAVGLSVAVSINYWKEITGTQGISFLWSMPLSLVAQVAVGMVASLLPIGRRPEIKPEDLIAKDPP